MARARRLPRQRRILCARCGRLLCGCPRTPSPLDSSLGQPAQPARLPLKREPPTPQTGLPTTPAATDPSPSGPADDTADPTSPLPHRR